MASFLSDRVVDEILESLSRSQHTLVGVLSAPPAACLRLSFNLCPPSVCLQGDHVIRKSHPVLRPEPPMETEVLDEMLLQPAEKHDQDLQDVDSCVVRDVGHRV